jgi:Domain of unknown function (DUF4145)
MEIYGQEARQRIAWLYCDQCKRDTKHTLLYGASDPAILEWEDNDGTVNRFISAWLIWQCNGCEFLAMEDTATAPDWFQNSHAACSHVNGICYPKKTELPLRHFRNIPKKIEGLYRETIEAFNGNLNTLCTVGLRSLMEGICYDKEVTGKDLREKIDRLTKLGITANITENLHGFRFMGNTAVHELTAADRNDLRLAIEIIEDLLNFIYDLDYKAKTLNDSQKQQPKFIVGEDPGKSNGR